MGPDDWDAGTTTASGSAPFTPGERRLRNRQEMIDAIVTAARAVMREHGVAALNLNEVARRVHLRPQSLAAYFPTKGALYDELFLRAVTLFADADEQAVCDHPPGWARIEALLAARIALADANPDLYRLCFDGFFTLNGPPNAEGQERIRQIRAAGVRMIADLVTAGVIDPGMPNDRAAALLGALRHGVISERLGKRPLVPDEPERFDALAPDLLRTLRVAWAPKSESGETGVAVGK